MGQRERVTSGSPYEVPIGFCRAIRVGDRVLVSGTAPVEVDGGCAEGADAQMRRCCTIALDALTQLGASAADVVRTRMYLLEASDWESVGRVHGEFFGEARPAATMVVVAGLLDPRWRIELEVEALL